MGMTVLLIRHGETIWQPEGRYQGISDVPLSEAGRAALVKVPFRPRAVFVSALCRTAQTAGILFPGVLQVPVSGLNEMHFGAFEGKTWQELSDRQDYRSWVEGGCLGVCPGGEDKASFCRRVCEAFESLMKNPDISYPDGELVIVAHAGSLMAILERYCRPARSYFDWYCGCGCGYRLDAEDWGESRILHLTEEVNFTGGN